ncbi:MAG: hypothetical protein F6K04_11765, partial [Leptolyngbya sp. SIO4C5]|nr:hypothetical protein [Leptolyngbya sp. SIO4C5]
MSPCRRVITLLALTMPMLMPGRSAPALAQTPRPQPPLLQVEGVLQDGDDTLSNGSFYDAYEFSGQAEQRVTLLLE